MGTKEKKGKEITEEQFRKYVNVQMSRATNMFNVRMVEDLSGLPRDVIMRIMTEYGELDKKYPDVKKEN